MAIPHAEREHFRVLATRANRELNGAAPERIIDWAVATFRDTFCLTASMADALLIDLTGRVRSDVPVLFLDTGYHFAETVATRDAVAARYRLPIRTVTPRQAVAEQDATFGSQLYLRNPDQCCRLRKVEPLGHALEPFYAWGSGVRRDESTTRRHTDVVEWDAARALVKVNPLASWTQDQVDDYLATHDVVRNPLLDEGYLSIGCAPCTRRVEPGDDPRSGRWAGLEKTECGLHSRI